MSQVNFFIHTVDHDGADLMMGPFIANLTQDQVMDEARAAFVGANCQPKAVLFNIGICPTAPEIKHATNWNGAESLRLFGIKQEASA
ncbi:hypothetical protein [Oceanisphaera pacifica]|uniref:Uncharacterized protein n=1 Tax=Oceanisphaera pacifica TaxID=2818389 RepID=A0ABS3NCC4_9GAMM|nr:hypothetical protein [Oceanisphaera pacifica]MBO1518243.1 hypothetical protein [Oceanisphaera pacifica]